MATSSLDRESDDYNPSTSTDNASPGAALISFGLPIVCYAMAFLCNDISGCPPPSLLHPSTFDLEQLKREVGWTGWSCLLNTKAVFGVFGYYFLSLVLYAFLPAEEPSGTQLQTGGRLKYRFNGKAQESLTRAVLAC